MKRLLRNLSFPNSISEGITLLVFALMLTCPLKGQVANYVNNGGFEKYTTISIYEVPLYWGATDSSKVFAKLLVYPQNVPSSYYTYQWPRHGKNDLITTLYSNFNYNNRGYPRNRLKHTLEAGHRYCVTFYVNLSNQSTHGIDAIGAYFGDSSLDTITSCNNPLTYLSPQVQNQNHNVITDTLNWVMVNGEFIANGTEKYMLIGNFKSDLNTDTTLVDTTNFPANGSDYLFDDVSVIDVDLPAFAGSDTIVHPGDSVFLGRESDVGIDEACIWFKLPNMTSAVDTIAGFWINPTSTATYVVKQQLICNNSPKLDTVVITVDPTVGIGRLTSSNNLNLFPSPVGNYVDLSFQNAYLKDSFMSINIYDNLGQEVKQEEVTLIEKKTRIDVSNLPNGAYLITITDQDHVQTIRKLLISR